MNTERAAVAEYLRWLSIMQNDSSRKDLLSYAIQAIELGVHVAWAPKEGQTHDR